MKPRLLFLLILFIIPIYVCADTINISCPNEVVSGSEFSCEITGTTSNGVTDVEFDYFLTSNLSFVTFVKSSGWNGDSDGGKVALYGGDTFKNTFKIGTLKVKNNGGTIGVITLNNIFFYKDENINSINSVSKSLSIKSISNNDKKNTDNNNNNNSNNGNENKTNNTNKGNSTSNNNATNEKNNDSNETTKKDDDKKEEIVVDDGIYLSDLKIDGYDIDFRKDIFNYDLTIGDESSLNITPSVDNNNLTFEIYNNENLVNGSKIYIEVRNKNDEIQTYYINITKEEKKKFNFTPVFITIIVVLVMFNVVRLLLGRRKSNEE